MRYLLTKHKNTASGMCCRSTHNNEKKYILYVILLWGLYQLSFWLGNASHIVSVWNLRKPLSPNPWKTMYLSVSYHGKLISLCFEYKVIVYSGSSHTSQHTYAGPFLECSTYLKGYSAAVFSVFLSMYWPGGSYGLWYHHWQMLESLQSLAL